MSSSNRGERIEYLGEVSRTETGRRESVVRGEAKTNVTTGFTTTKYSNDGRSTSNVKTYTSGDIGNSSYRISSGNRGQGETTGLVEVSR